MVDAYNRWVIHCDAEVHSGARRGPAVRLENYVDDIASRAASGHARRVYDREHRIMRIADTRIVDLPSGHSGLAMVVTLGNRRSAISSVLHYDEGTARDPELFEGEVPASSAHMIVELAQSGEHVGRYRMLMEEVPNIGHSPVTSLLRSELRTISKEHGERFRSPDTGNEVMLQPQIEIWPKKAQGIERALAQGRLDVVELYDTRRPPSFDEHPEFVIKRRTLRVQLAPSDDEAASLLRLRKLGRDEGYSQMKMRWSLPDGGHADADIRTDLEDVGTALIAERERIELEHALSGATHQLNDEFVGAIAAHFV